MADAKPAPNLPNWMVEHINRYLASGGTDGHMYAMTQPGLPQITAPSLLLTTTGRKSGEKYIFPLFYGDPGEGGYVIVAPRKAGRPSTRNGTSTSRPTRRSRHRSAPKS